MAAPRIEALQNLLTKAIKQTNTNKKPKVKRQSKNLIARVTTF